MSVVLIVILLLVAVFVAASVALGRATYEVEDARDTEYLELEGNWIRYRVLGGGPPVVLVHGWLSSGRVWDRLADRLAQRFTVYTLDLSGFGDSDKPISGYGVRYGSRLLYAFCAHFGLTRAAVVGHDVGGAMAIKLAADHPDIVGRLVLVATPADEEQVDLPTGLWLATLPVVGPVFYWLGSRLRFVRKLWVRPFVSDSDDLTDEAVDDAGRSTPAAAAKTLNVMQREISRGRLVRQAGIIKVPVLAIAGEEDQIVDPQALVDWNRAFPSAEILLMDGVGHLPMLESTGEFNARILAFLTGDPRYLEMIEEPAEAEPDDEEGFPAWSEDEDDAPPTVHRKRDGSYSPQRDPEEEPETADDEATLELGEEGLDRGEDPDEAAPRGAAGREGREQRRREARRRGHAADEGGDGIDGPSQHVPGDLFEWPEAWKEFRPRREPFQPGREPGEAQEQREEGPEEEGPRLP